MSETRASQTGGESPHSAREFVERDLQIVLSYRRGVSAKTLAHTHALTPRRVHQIVTEWEDWEPGSLTAATRGRELEQINRALQMAEQLVEDAVLVYSRAINTKHVPLQLGALRRREEAFALLTGIQRAAGILPANLTGPSREQAVLELVAKIIDLLRERGDEELLAAMLRLVESQRLPIGSPPAIEAVAGAAA